MCFAKKPKQIVAAPIPRAPEPVQPAKVDRGSPSKVTSKGKSRRRGTARNDLVIDKTPSGVNTGTKGVGVYS